jgi:hypothetical protein
VPRRLQSSTGRTPSIAVTREPRGLFEPDPRIGPTATTREHVWRGPLLFPCDARRSVRLCRYQPRGFRVPEPAVRRLTVVLISATQVGDGFTDRLKSP